MATGYGIIESDGRENRYIAHGVIEIGKLEIPERLGRIHQTLVRLIDEWQPAEAAIEAVFVSRNAASALKLGQARGVAIAACTVSHVPVYEYSARAVKQAVVGTGAAAKEQVQHMSKSLLSVRGRLQADAADALAVAICHGHDRLHRYNSALAPRRRPSGRARRRSR